LTINNNNENIKACILRDITDVGTPVGQLTQAALRREECAMPLIAEIRRKFVIRLKNNKQPHTNGTQHVTSV
jgi:hypothetical protein